MSEQEPEQQEPKLEAGSGITTVDIMKRLTETLAGQFKTACMQRGIPKASVEKMEAGFRDGTRSMWRALKEMGVINVVDDRVTVAEQSAK